jgi:succinate dehydrogenase / fumarate reductase, iron-sulfur subunit
MRIVLRIRRFSPGQDAAPYDRDYAVDVAPTDRILDALLAVQSRQDGSLSFRKSCAHGVCGSDAMIIAGVERLACKTLVRDVAGTEKAANATGAVAPVVTVEPLRHMPVQRDLMVDQAGFFRRYREVRPYLVNNEPVPERERVQSVAQRAAFDDATSCILCGSCNSSCPVFDGVPDYIGPAALVQAARFLFDSRDLGLAERLPILDRPQGAWGCQNHFNCTRVCPREIKVTKNINAIKRTIEKAKGSHA